MDKLKAEKKPKNIHQWARYLAKTKKKKIFWEYFGLFPQNEFFFSKNPPLPIFYQPDALTSCAISRKPCKPLPTDLLNESGDFTGPLFA